MLIFAPTNEVEEMSELRIPADWRPPDDLDTTIERLIRADRKAQERRARPKPAKIMRQIIPAPATAPEAVEAQVNRPRRLLHQAAPPVHRKRH